MRTVEFKVMETDPAEYCIVGYNTVIFFGGLFVRHKLRFSYQIQRVTPSGVKMKSRTLGLVQMPVQSQYSAQVNLHCCVAVARSELLAGKLQPGKPRVALYIEPLSLAGLIVSLVDPSSTPVTPVKDPHSPTGSFPPPEPPPSAEELRDVNSKHNEPTYDPEPEPEPDPVQIAAEKFNEHGNDLFKRGRYDEAVDLYTKAIGTSSAPLYKAHSARPRCYCC
jgi:hypothetical protein